jgi:nitrogen-specific signal transduction histidine kinase
MMVDTDPEMPPIPLDHNLMHQALMNLMTNAVEAVPTTTARSCPSASVPRAGPEHPTLAARIVEISVIDNGPGIPKNKINWIFEPFHTTKGSRARAWASR